MPPRHATPTPAATNPESAILGAMPGAEQFFRLGMMYSTGQSTPANLVSAHKWFNIAAMNGSRHAVRLRHEIAAEMSKDEIAAAQRAARDWVTRH
jgi:TPR repeat protein